MARNRVRELRMMKGRDLIANPKNYREHPEAQRELMQGVLEEVGIVGAAVGFEVEDEDGELRVLLIDGHMRGELLADDDVPVLIVDLSEEEADKVIATYDPIGAMAQQNDAMLEELLVDIDAEDANLRRYIAQAETGIEERQNKADEQREREREKADEVDPAPGMELSPHEHYDYLIIGCSTVREWQALLDRFDIKPVRRRGRVGIGRAIRASHVLAKIGTTS